MWTDIKRIVQSGFVSFWRNGFVSLAAILVMTVTLFTIGSVLFLNALLGASLAQIEEKVDINVYFVVDAPEDEILTLKRTVETLPQVASVLYTSRDEALERFRTRHENDALTLQALEELSDNPLGASLSIKAQDTSQYEAIANFLESDGSAISEGSASIIDSVNFFENRAAIERLSKIIDSSERFGLLISLILALSSIVIVFNTVRLAIYTAKDEIAVMKLVGASNTYIRGPFVFEGVMYGIFAGLVTLASFYPLTLWLGPSTEAFFGDINIFSYYTSHFGQMFFVIMGAGIALGALSSYLAVRKYLRI